MRRQKAEDRIPNSELRIPNCELRTANSELRTPNCELRTANPKPQNGEPQIATDGEPRLGMQNSEPELRISNLETKPEPER